MKAGFLLLLPFLCNERLAIAPPHTLPDRVAVNCRRLIFSDVTTRLTLVAQDFSLTEKLGGVDLLIRNSTYLPALKKLHQPLVQFCYHGHPIVACGNPVFSSAIPPGAKAFYLLNSTNNSRFFGNRLPIIIVEKIISKQK